MCGISALVSLSGAQPLLAHVRAMTDVARHRGPDGEGYALWSEESSLQFFGGPDTTPDIYASGIAARPERDGPRNAAATVALGHRRLAILDRGPGGHQPMMTRGGEVVIVYNGEIYNHQDVRAELVRLGHRFESRSDTEVILQAWLEWGPACLQRFNGMFAFVLFEPRRRRLFVARDRYGVKPCYVWRSPQGLLAVASEIKQFTALPGWSARLDAQRAYDFLSFGVTDHHRHTMFSGVTQLRGGEYLDCSLAECGDANARIQRWYVPAPVDVRMPIEDAAQRFRELFTDAVSLRLHADVPVGTGLSGGLDSSSIVCTANELLRAQDATAVQNTFSACSDVKEYDERRHVERVVEHTGVRAHYVYTAVDGFLERMHAMAWHHDEPIGGTSVFAEWCVYALTATTPVRVTLDGHGADELLAGYHSYFGHHFADLFWRGKWARLVAEMRAANEQHGYGPRLALANVAGLGAAGNVTRALRRMLGNGHAQSDWIETRALGVEERDLWRELGAMQVSVNAFSVSQLFDSNLPVQLRACDRDSMAHSIESRAPFLDYRVVEFLLGCPSEFKISGGTTKRLLRSAMRGVLPEGTLARQDKVGFVAPEEVWIRRQQPQRFKELAAAAVDRAQGIVNGHALERANRIIDGTEPFDGFVTRIICFGQWLDAFRVAVR
jgi:asparagine synthase (glutamine-hydrolysing)